MKFQRIAGLLCLLVVRGAWTGGSIRLKTRIIDTERVERPLQPGARSAAVRHFIVQFYSYPGPAVRDELARRHILVLGYVPDNSLMVSAGRSLNLAGLDVSWAGPLEPSDKISPALATLPAGSYVVIFHSDVDMAEAEVLVEQQGFQILKNPDLLPSQLLATGNSNVAGLAASDLVAYILPASADLVMGNHVMGCAGPIAEAGPIGDYVTVGNGWASDPRGGVGLLYFFDSVTGKLDGTLARSEIERAFREWARYANISFSPAGAAALARSVDILFASGAHGDAYPFDGPGGVLAHTFYPAPPNTEPVAGDMHFDDSENWNVGKDVDLYSVALHEAGHALGLGHSDNPGSVMYPYYRISSGLTADDIAGIQALYGSPGGTPAPPSPTPTPTPTPTPPAPTPPSGGTDTTPPALTIISPGSTIVSVYSGTIAMYGTATDNVGVTTVKWSTSTGSSGLASGTATWSVTIPLLVGNNVVTVTAYDAAGNSGWRAVTVVRH